MSFAGTLISILFCAAALSSLRAQEQPAETIQIVIPSAPGGGMDVIGRLLARFLQDNQAGT